jgi:hypothetical protein
VAAWVLPIVSGVQQNLQPVYRLNSSNAVVPLPLNVTAANTALYLEMYGTGVRGAKNVTAASVTRRQRECQHHSHCGWANSQYSDCDCPMTLPDLCIAIPAYFIGEKSVALINTESTLLTIFPLASDSFCTFCHSGSLPNSAQFFLAASRLACEMT